MTELQHSTPMPPAWADGPDLPVATAGGGFQDLFAVLRRRRVMIGVVVAGFTLGAIAFVKLATPLYTASTQVIVEPQENAALAAEQPQTQAARPDVAMLQSEIQVVRSVATARTLIERFRLAEREEFVPTPDPSSLLTRIGDAYAALTAGAQALLVELGVADPPVPPSEAALKAARDAALLDAFMSRLQVTVVGESRVLQISVTSQDPVLATEMADAVANEYIQLRASAQQNRQASVLAWMQDRLKELQVEAREREKAVDSLRETMGLYGDKGSTLVGEQVMQLNAQLAEARIVLEQKRALLARLKESIAQNGLRSVFSIMSSDIVNTLLRDEAELRQQELGMNSSVGPLHPQMKAMQAKRAGTTRAIEQQARATLQMVTDDMELARAKVASLETSIDTLRSTASSLQSQQGALQTLQREAEVSWSVLQKFLGRIEETKEPPSRLHAWVVSMAAVPVQPSYPRKPVIVALAFVGSLIAAAALVLLRELLDRKVNSVADIRDHLAVRPLGIAPRVARGLRDHRQLHERISDDPDSAEAEALRGCFLTLRRDLMRSPSPILLVTSATAGEGKSSVSLALAHEAARTGARVLVVDCDMRNGSLWKKTGQHGGPGLTDYLEGTAAPEELIRTLPHLGFDVILTTHMQKDAAAALGSSDFLSCLARVSQRYDLVILDAPPLLAASDGRILAELATHCLFVVQWKATARQTAAAALDILRQTDIPILGAVLSKVDLRKVTLYGQESIGYHARAYR